MSSSETPSPSTLTEGQDGGNKNKFIIIIVSCIGGFVVTLVLVLILVPFLRRCVRRRQSRDLEEVQSRGVGGVHAHARSASGPDSSAPLLSGKSLEVEVFQPYPVREPEREEEREGLEGEEHPPSTDNSDEPLTPGSTSGSARMYNPWSAVSTAPPRFLRPSTTLKRARPRIGHTHTPLEPLPEGSRADPISTPMPSPVPPPSPNEVASPPTSPGSDAHPSWLHVPKPLISAFRKSLAASSISSNASSLPAMQHYPSFNASSSVSGERSRSPDTFHSFSSVSANSAALSHSHVLLPVNTNATQRGEGLLSVPARLKPSGASEHVATVQSVSPSALPSSRAASFLGGSSMSGASVYVDARSRVDEESVGGRSR